MGGGRGPAGETGPQGPQGETGPQGPAASRSAVTITSTTTLTSANDLVLADASGGGFSVNLPDAAANPSLEFTIKKIDATSNAVTIDGAGTQTIDDSPTQEIIIQYTAITVQSDPSAGKWWIK